MLKEKLKRILADKDEKNLFQNIFFAFLVKGLSLFISIFSMPLYIKYFSDDTALGLWYTILSLLSWISICDLGLGNGLRNKLTEALSNNDSELGRKFISSTYAIVFSIIFPIIIVANLLIRIVDLNLFFNVSSNVINQRSMVISISVLVVGVGLNFVLKLINNIVYAIQKSSINNAISLISSIIPLIYIYWINGGDANRNLIRLSIVHVAALNIPLIIATVILFTGKKLKEYRPTFKSIQLDVAKKMLNFGARFFVAQLCFMVLMSTNETIITRFYAPQYVVEYTIYNRISTMIGSVFMLALTPLWSKITKDLAEKKFQKIKNTNKVLYMLSLVAVVSQFLVIPILQWVLDIWLREGSITVDYMIAVVFALYGGLYIFNIVLTTVANGMGELKTQVVFYGIGALLKIPLAIIFSKLNMPWYSIVIYNCGVLLIFCVYQYFWVENKMKKITTLEEK